MWKNRSTRLQKMTPAERKAWEGRVKLKEGK